MSALTTMLEADSRHPPEMLMLLSVLVQGARCCSGEASEAASSIVVAARPPPPVLLLLTTAGSSGVSKFSNPLLDHPKGCIRHSAAVPTAGLALSKRQVFSIIRG